MPKYMNISPTAISFLVTVTFTGAFVLTTAGNQYFGMASYGKAPAWLAAISGGYVMVFSRGIKQFVEIRAILGKLEADSKEQPSQSSIAVFCIGLYHISRTLLIPQKKLHPAAWVVWSLSLISGFFRSITQGLTSTKTLLNAVYVYNSKHIHNASIFVAFTNAVAFQNFTVNKTAENIHKLLHLSSGYWWQKIVTTIIGLFSIVGTFGYNNQQITHGFTTAPKLGVLSSISIPITIISVGIGGTSKGVQVVETLISMKSKKTTLLVTTTILPETAYQPSEIVILEHEKKQIGTTVTQVEESPKLIENNPSQPKINWSWKVKLHILMGVLYVAFFCIISEKGLSPFMPDGLLWGILTWIIAGSTAVMEGPFTVGYMIEEQISREKNEALKQCTLFSSTNQNHNLETPFLNNLSSSSIPVVGTLNL